MAATSSEGSVARIEVTDLTAIKVMGDLRWTGKARFPGSLRGRSIVVFQRDGEVFAIPAFCPHEQANLAEASFVAPYVLQCPLHHNEYDLRSGAIKAFRIELEHEKLYLLWDAAARAPVAPHFGATASPEKRAGDERELALQREVEALTEAARLREHQTLETLRQMDSMVAEVDQKRRLLERTNSQIAEVNDFVGRVTNTMSEVLLVLDTQGRIKQANQRLYDLLGYSAEEVLGHPIDRLLAADDLQRLLSKGRASGYAALAAKAQGEFDVALKTKSGERADHLLRTSVLFGPSGKKEGLVVVGTDIREIKGAQRELGVAYEKVTGLLNNMRQAVFVVVASGEIIEPASRFSATVFGGEIVGKNVFDVLFKDVERGSEAFSLLNTAFLTTFDAEDFQWDLMSDLFPTRVLYRRTEAASADEQLAILRVSYCPLRDGAGLMDRMMIVVDDITRIERLERQMAEEKAANQRRIQIVEELVRNKVEDLRVFLASASTLLTDARALVARGPLEGERSVVLMRNLHTLKGNARVLGLRLVATTTHDAESEANALLCAEPSASRVPLAERIADVQRVVGEYGRLASKILRIPNDFEVRTYGRLHHCVSALDAKVGAWIGGSYGPAVAELDAEALGRLSTGAPGAELRSALDAVREAASGVASQPLDVALRDLEQSLVTLDALGARGAGGAGERALDEPLATFRRAYVALVDAAARSYLTTAPACSLSATSWVSLFLGLFAITAAAEGHAPLELDRAIESAISSAGALGEEYVATLLSQLASERSAEHRRDVDAALLREAWRHLAFVSVLESLAVLRAEERKFVLAAVAQGEHDSAAMSRSLDERKARAGCFVSFLSAQRRAGTDPSAALRTIGRLFGHRSAVETTRMFLSLRDIADLDDVLAELATRSSCAEANSVFGQLAGGGELFHAEDSATSLYLKKVAIGRLIASVRDLLGGNFQLLCDRVQTVEVMAYNLNTLKRTLGSYREARTDDALQLLQHRLDRLLDVPLLPALFRYHDTVQETAAKLQKRVELRISGDGSIALPRDELYVLQEALVHMLRNALDHGLERPDERLAVGKSEIGIVGIDCAREHGVTTILVHDDGRGIDPDRVGRKVVELGLKTAAEVAALDRDELVRLVMLPHLSTATVVSDISGRGIGMDVVAANLAKIGARLDIKTEIGRGTEMRIALCEAHAD
jgi:PAS domain S-box-containing protein